MRKARDVDGEIEREYYKQAQGKQIELIDILKLFAHARMMITNGASVNYAVQSGIELFCKEVK